MLKHYKLLSFVLSVLIIISVCGCSPVDNDYGVSSETETIESKFQSVEDTKIMSSDRVMSQYFDISLFDEENYSDIYLGKKFKIDAVINNSTFKVPTKLSDFEELGWYLCEGNTYDEKSLVFAYETVDLYFKNESGVKIFAQVYNSSRSSKQLYECYIVKFKIDNNFYVDSENYVQFNVNGIDNSMAITDIVNILGTPSHFYKVSDTSYYLDYFITKKDRRNGITVYINPVDDLITAIEFSYYK